MTRPGRPSRAWPRPPPPCRIWPARWPRPRAGPPPCATCRPNWPPASRWPATGLIWPPTGPRIGAYRGGEVWAPPQVALCRCGASARKPFCDGTHASNGFTGDKDPERVPDHRDRYDGEQVTVFDNRGVCQHSGLCTDRLNTVFRTSTEPFVAPSGGRMDEIVRAIRDCPSGALGLAFDGHGQSAL